MVGVPVSHHDRALEFYVGVLGLEKRHDYFFGDDDRWIEVAPIGSETTIALVLAPQRGEPENETEIRLSVQTNHDRGVDDLTAMHAELRDRGGWKHSQDHRLRASCLTLAGSRKVESEASITKNVRLGIGDGIRLSHGRSDPAVSEEE